MINRLHQRLEKWQKGLAPLRSVRGSSNTHLTILKRSIADFLITRNRICMRKERHMENNRKECHPWLGNPGCAMPEPASCGSLGSVGISIKITIIFKEIHVSERTMSLLYVLCIPKLNLKILSKSWTFFLKFLIFVRYKETFWPNKYNFLERIIAWWNADITYYLPIIPPSGNYKPLNRVESFRFN